METVYDFGKKIGGSRKDRAAAMAEADRRAGIVTTTRRTRRPPRYGVYYSAADSGVYVARIVSGRRPPLAIGRFASVAEARAWIGGMPAATLDRLHREALAAQSIGDEQCRRPANRPRTGPDYRNGLPIAPHAFLREFALYGVEFGNWQDNRQTALDRAYDALRDLATTVGIPAEAIGFGGKLGLAFGARGTGHAAAHYEPNRFAINLTKTQGAGCLAHEWFHAYDHHASAGGAAVRQYTGTPGLRELAAVLRGLDMYRRARRADQRRTKPYWSEPQEMAARAFEAWVRSRVENDYLANIRTPAEFERPGDCYPYPLAEEMPTIDAAFRKLFAVQ